MKVSVCYTIVKDVTIEISDKFKPLADDSLPVFCDYRGLTNEMLEALYTADEIPDDCDIISVFDEETDEVMYES